MAIIFRYQRDVDLSKLKVQLFMLRPALDVEESSQAIQLKNVKEAFQRQPVVRKMLSEVYTLLRIYLTVPVTTSTAERAFSVLRRTKTYLRATMSQQRLNHCLLLHAHRVRTDNLDLNDIARRFCSVNDRRTTFFGAF